MAEREADRGRPELLRRQAVVAFLSDSDREISPGFRRKMKEHDAAPTFFGANEMASMAQTGLEADIARSIGHGQKCANAICEALRRRGEGYAREQICQLLADRHPEATLVSESVKKACNEGASLAATLILTDQLAPRQSDRLQLSENLLVRPSSGAGP